MLDELTIHVRLPKDTTEALMKKRKTIGEDIPLSIVVRRILDEALGVKRKVKG